MEKKNILRLVGLAAKVGMAPLTGGASLLSMKSGGVVPGPKGKARLIIAHGGETIIPADSGRSTRQADFQRRHNYRPRTR